MRFLIGLLLGFGIGFAGALLLAPERQRREEEAPGEEAFRGEDHDAMAALRRAMKQLQEQVQEAWQEARQAAREAEGKMRARYERTVFRPKR